MIRAEFNGRPAPELILQRTEIRFTDTHYAIHFDGQPADRGTFKVEETGESKLLILHAESGPNAGRTIPCIYQLVGDRLRLCFGLDGTTPATFTTSAASHRYLATCRRL